MPNRVSPRIIPRIPIYIDSNGTIVSIELLSKIEMDTLTADAATQAHTVCPPIGIFAKARFIACSRSTARKLSIDANELKKKKEREIDEVTKKSLRTFVCIPTTLTTRSNRP